MKKVKIKLNDLVSPERLSAEKMKEIRGGQGHWCSLNPCDAEGEIGECFSWGQLCSCWVESGYSSQIECWD